MFSMLATAAMFASAPLAAADGGAAPSAAPAKERKICKDVGNIHSRIKTNRVCLSRSEWNEISRRNRQEWDDRGSTGR